jgi:hypothetical protein
MRNAFIDHLLAAGTAAWTDEQKKSITGYAIPCE